VGLFGCLWQILVEITPAYLGQVDVLAEAASGAAPVTLCPAAEASDAAEMAARGAPLAVVDALPLGSRQGERPGT
jgi:hypothetical protein